MFKTLCIRPALVAGLLGSLLIAGTANAATRGEVGDVPFVNGGITQPEAEQMRQEAVRYPLEVVLAQRGEGGHNDFLAGAQLRVTDASGRVVFERGDAGPILLADLPDGAYTVEATSNGQTQTRHVRIAGSEHEKVTFLWQ
jgi:hypothetical protein